MVMALGQDSLGRLDGFVDLEFTKGLQLTLAIFKDRFDDPQPIVAQTGSMSRGHIAKRIQSNCGLCRISHCAVSSGERKRLNQLPSADGHNTSLLFWPVPLFKA